MNRRVAIIGGGWAGLAAAEALAEHAQVMLFEAGKQLGGRARAMARQNQFSFLDNGQHILMGAYHQCLALLQRAGISVDEVFFRQPLTWHMADGIQFQAACLPKPWHLAMGVLCARRVGFAERLQLLQQMHRLQTWYAGYRQNKQDISAAQWLANNGVGHLETVQFWQPLIWGGLNTDLAAASTARLANMLNDGVWQRRQDSDMLIAKTDLGKAWVMPICELLQRKQVGIQTHYRVPPPMRNESGQWQVGGETFDAVIVATAPYHAAALLPPQIASETKQALDALRYHAITTVYLRYSQAVRLPAALTGLVNGTAQWLQARSAVGGDVHEVAAVVSVSDLIGINTTNEWVRRVHADVLSLCPNLPMPEEAQVITEKRATVQSRFDALPIPTAGLRKQKLYLAGDYLHPRYPSTLEAAVQSGQAAAAQCLADFQQCC
ncbi:hydroxysqualene dehydroxylase HpnE [Stenoxybacter acetivorans]|uniref:hydroxysqualene dehydroxylase HpnE n=1 Tax=Stenoxybacter acetivorans TaxID=422441 RepID=UPI00056A7439|nr:hydroxysqualene dehydroxylase HpnE [Stenoxybacter acetivorans]